ncbi:MAG: carbon-nitrogen hydrolase, partial [Planctomycetota bacterium]
MPANSNKPGTPASNNKASGRSARAAAASAARPRVIVRQLRASDHDEVAALQNASYGGGSAWTREQFQSQLAVFPEGQICVVLDGKVCATSSSMIVDRAEMRANHTYDEITDGSTIRTHDPEGDFLYGIDMCVHPGKRGLRLAHRLYDERKELIEQMGLRGMIIAGRMPNYHKHADKMSAEEYVRRVTHKELRDPVVTAQVANGFHIIGLLKNYLPSDNESRGWAVLMEWHSPNYVPESLRKAGTGIVRVADVQYQMRTVTSFEEFCTQCEFFIDTAGDYNCDFLLFPELLTNQLLSLVPDERPGLSARQLDQFTQRYIEFFTSMAIKYDVNIIGG